jgi:hypothetical protein
VNEDEEIGEGRRTAAIGASQFGNMLIVSESGQLSFYQKGHCGLDGVNPGRTVRLVASGSEPAASGLLANHWLLANEWLRLLFAHRTVNYGIIIPPPLALPSPCSATSSWKASPTPAPAPCTARLFEIFFPANTQS